MHRIRWIVAGAMLGALVTGLRNVYTGIDRMKPLRFSD